MPNWKIAFLGGLAYYAAQWIVSFVTGPLLHEGILVEAYKAHAQFWRPELNQEPPDMAALLPRWITWGLIGAFISAAIYSVLRPALAGPGWQRGLKFGVIITLLHGAFMAGWSGVFNLPDMIWMWWWAESVFYFLIGGATLGWVAEKLAPVGRP